MKVLITGGRGYLGSRLAVELAAHGHQVICLNRDGQTRPALACGELVQFVTADVCDTNRLAVIARDSDVIVHSAYIVGGPACKRVPDEAARVAIDGTQSVLRASDGKHLVFTSSDVVYGNAATGVCAEDTACDPNSLYDRLKLQSERLIQAAGAPYTILRLPSHFGVAPTMRSDLLVHWFAEAAHRRGELLLAQPDITRSLVHVHDSARAIRLVIEQGQSTLGQVFNVASGAWKKADIARTVAELFPGTVIRCDETWLDPDARDFVLDCSRLRRTGWMPQYSLEQGVRELRDHLGNVPHSSQRSAATGTR